MLFDLVSDIIQKAFWNETIQEVVWNTDWPTDMGENEPERPV